MILVCKQEDGATIYSIDGEDAVEMGSIWDATPLWAIEDGDESQIDWQCHFDTRDGYVSGDSLEECIERFVAKAAHGYDVPEVFDGTIEEYLAI